MVATDRELECRRLSQSQPVSLKRIKTRTMSTLEVTFEGAPEKSPIRKPEKSLLRNLLGQRRETLAAI